MCRQTGKVPLSIPLYPCSSLFMSISCPLSTSFRVPFLHLSLSFYNTSLLSVGRVANISVAVGAVPRIPRYILRSLPELWIFLEPSQTKCWPNCQAIIDEDNSHRRRSFWRPRRLVIPSWPFHVWKKTRDPKWTMTTLTLVNISLWKVDWGAYVNHVSDCLMGTSLISSPINLQKKIDFVVSVSIIWFVDRLTRKLRLCPQSMMETSVYSDQRARPWVDQSI